MPSLTLPVRPLELLTRHTAAVATVLLILVLVVPTTSHLPTRPHAALTVAALFTQVSQHPRRWVGPTLRVWGTALGGGRWVDPPGTATRVFIAAQPRLVDPVGSAYFVLVSRPANPLLAYLRHMGWLGPWLPHAQRVVYGAPQVYRIELEVAPGIAPPTYQAVLVDTE